MKPIELELWKQDQEDQHQFKYVGQPVAEAVFIELGQRLEGMGLMPDEYFLMDRAWENGREIPKGADVFVTTDYGESEGIYLDGYLKWYEDDKPITESFFTGKTLGETGADLDRMFLISSAITKAFHGDYGQYARFVKLGPEEQGGDMVVNLTPDEQRIFIGALLERRERMREQTDSVEQLLRRMTGSITAYMDLIGERPLRISDYDKAVLAIHDGELQAFKELLPRIHNRVGDLLVEAAGRAGEVGRKMTVEVVAYAPEFMRETYTAASKKAVDVCDTERVRFLMEQAPGIVADLDPAYYGEIIDYAYSEHQHLGQTLIHSAPNEWIAAAPPELLIRTTTGRQDLRTAQTLIAKGLPTTSVAATVLQNLTADPRDGWMAEHLLNSGMAVAQNDYRALNACVKNGAVECAKLLLKRGADFEGYLAWNERHDRRSAPEGVIKELTEYAQTLSQQAATPQAQSRSGPTMEMSL